MFENRRNKATSNNVLQQHVLTNFNNRSVYKKKIKVRNGPNKDDDTAVLRSGLKMLTIYKLITPVCLCHQAV